MALDDDSYAPDAEERTPPSTQESPTGLMDFWRPALDALQNAFSGMVEGSASRVGADPAMAAGYNQGMQFMGLPSAIAPEMNQTAGSIPEWLGSIGRVAGNMLPMRGGVGDPMPGLKRLYHGQGGAQGAGQSSWFSTNPQRAASYGPDLHYVDVPEEVFKAGAAKAKSLGSGTGGDAVLEAMWLKLMKALAQKPKQKVYDLGDLGAP